MTLKEFYELTYQTISSWHTNHTEFGAFVEWRECWWLPNDLLVDGDTALELGWTLEQAQDDFDSYCQEWMDWYIDDSCSQHGIPMRKIINQVESVLSGLGSSDVWECLASLTQAVHLAHGNGSILHDYFIGNRNIVESVGQNGLEVTFPDLQLFIENYSRMEC